jgi:methionyl-tRNA formyltransferase
MKLAIFGRTKILLAAARALADAGHTICVVGTAKASDTDGAVESDFESAARLFGAKFFRGRMQSVLDVIGESGSELGVSMNWPTILGEKEIGLFPHGVLNAHAGDLPRYRGNACPNWAILNGEERIGLCIHRMLPRDLDAGPIALRRYFALAEDSYIGDVYGWMNAVVPEMFVEVVHSIENGTASFAEQEKHPGASLRCFPRRPEDAKIDWARDHKTISRLIRASSRPFHGAFATLEHERKVVVWRGSVIDFAAPYCAVPGQVIHADSMGATIACGYGSLILTEASFEDGTDALSTIGASLRNRLI